MRALPDFQHTVVFRSSPTRETRKEFEACRGVKKLLHARLLTKEIIASSSPDLILLHNTGPAALESTAGYPTMQYVHSGTTSVVADRSVCCSTWLANQRKWPQQRVLLQSVPKPSGEQRAVRTHHEERLIVGRICTPTIAKWPLELISFYKDLAERFPAIQWEFVGCPPEQQDRYSVACQNRAVFHEAGWNARCHLTRWHVLLYHHPSMSESFGRTVAEARRAGCVPVVVNRGGFQEQISAKTGFLCNHADEYAQALHLLHDPQKWKVISEATEQEADEKFSFLAFRERLLDQFSQMSS